MYVVATLHLSRFWRSFALMVSNGLLYPLVLAAFRFYKSIFLNVDPNGAISYLNSFHHWEYLWLIILFCVQTWLGDALVVSGSTFISVSLANLTR
jgi:hypothetical protein